MRDSSRRRNDLDAAAAGSKASAAVAVDLGAAERAREEAGHAPGHGQHGAAPPTRDPRGAGRERERAARAAGP